MPIHHYKTKPHYNIITQVQGEAEDKMLHEHMYVYWDNYNLYVWCLHHALKGDSMVYNHSVTSLIWTDW